MAQPIFLVQSEHEFGEFLIRTTGAEFTIQKVSRGLGERLVIDGIDGLMKRLDIEQRILDPHRIFHEPFVNTPAPARGTTKLTTGTDMLGLNTGYGLLD